MLHKNKRAQTANNAAMLIAIIMGLILLYILFISPEERDKLLSDDDSTSTGTGTTSSKNYTWKVNETLVDEKPGRLDYVKRDTFDHTVPSVNLFSQTDSKVVKEVDSAYVKNGVFGYEKYETNFFLENPTLASNILLTFNVKSGTGNLIIWLNDKIIFNSPVKNLNNPISLPADMIRSDNKLVFWVSDVSWIFWTKNEYSLTSIRIIGDVKDVSKTQATAKFWLSNEEKNYIDKVTLKFSPECDSSNVGTLSININENNIYSGIPDCRILNSYDFSGDKVLGGENTIGFSLNSGKAIVDRITLTTKLKEMIYPTYYFELDSSDMDAINKGKLLINFSVSFTNNVDFKKVNFFINARPSIFQTYEGHYTENISNAVQAGTNTMELRPEKTSVDIPNLKIQTFTKKK